jgi:putative endonuclease
VNGSIPGGVTVNVSHESGVWGEKLAARYMRKQGYKVLGVGVRLGPRDELDVIARKKDLLVFVEVKTRKSEDYGRPADAVNTAKRRTISRAAVHYLRECSYPNVYLRFDVIEIVGQPGDRDPVFRHIENAFTLDRRFSLPY